MDDIKTITSKTSFKNLDNNLKKEYAISLKNDNFVSLINKVGIKENIAYKHTSKLENTVLELENCKNCKNINCCKNKVQGYINYPILKEDILTFSYIACKYMKKNLDNKSKSRFISMPNSIQNARMKDVDIEDKKRANVIKRLKLFYDNFEKGKFLKGLYLHGNFGSGKTFLIAAMLNELSEKGINVVVVYYPEMLREIKSNFKDGYKEYLDEILDSEILLIDDIGAENTSEWGRDEILGTILQHRMDNNLITFFTSNLTIDELETHLATSKNSLEFVKARRIIERIKYLTEDVELIGKNRR